MLPFFKRTESHHDPEGDKEQHGFEGPIHTSNETRYPLFEAVKGAFEEVGYKEVKDANGGDPRGLARWTENFYEGRRQPAGVAYDLSGVKVVTHALAKRVLIEKTEVEVIARGVELVDGQRYMARKEVIISCGALRTPQILMLSGVGPAEQLEKIRVEQLVNSPEVGRNFWDHCAIMQYWRLRSPKKGLSAGSPLFDRPEYALGMPFDWMVTDTIPAELLRPALEEDGENAVSHPHLCPQCCHYEMMFGYAVFGRGVKLGIPLDGSHVTSIVLNLRPTSRGAITLSSADPSADPIINPNYNATHTDRLILRHSLRRMQSATETASARTFLASETPPPGFAALTSRSADAELDARIRAHATTLYHPGGSAAMGKVLGAQLRVVGVRGLRVCDASVFPVVITGHTQCTAYALAEQAAEIIAGVGG